jgi:hypothetical protein
MKTDGKHFFVTQNSQSFGQYVYRQKAKQLKSLQKIYRWNKLLMAQAWTKQNCIEAIKARVGNGSSVTEKYHIN